MMPLLLSDSVTRDLLHAAREAAPEEAAGVLLNESIVVVLPNHANDRLKHFELHKEDIRGAIPDDLPLESLAIWHSHPSGGVGPSRTDLRNKVVGVPHLVVTLIDDDIVSTWY